MKEKDCASEHYSYNSWSISNGKMGGIEDVLRLHMQTSCVGQNKIANAKQKKNANAPLLWMCSNVCACLCSKINVINRIFC